LGCDAKLHSPMEAGRVCHASLRRLEIARRIDASSTAVKERYEIHRIEIAGRGCYSERLQETTAELLACLG
jgi:hypothetical protein